MKYLKKFNENMKHLKEYYEYDNIFFKQIDKDIFKDKVTIKFPDDEFENLNSLPFIRGKYKFEFKEQKRRNNTIDYDIKVNLDDKACINLGLGVLNNYVRIRKFEDNSYVVYSSLNKSNSYYECSTINGVMVCLKYLINLNYKEYNSFKEMLKKEYDLTDDELNIV
jgi:hypothetical protein